MTFCLIRYEICNLTRKLTYVPPGRTPCSMANERITIEDKERMVREVADHLEQTYLQHCDNAGPLYWVSATVARLILSKMSLIIYHPLVQPGKPNSLSQDVRDRLFMASIEIIEYSRVLESETTTKQWGWLFHTYIQWHAIAYILGELCTRPNSTIVQRAWKCIDVAFGQWAANGGPKQAKNGMLWRPMHKLLNRAMKKREENDQTSNNDTENNGLGIPPMYLRPPVAAYTDPSPCPGNIARDRLLEQQASAVVDGATSNIIKDLSGFTNAMNVASYNNTSIPPQIVGGTGPIPRMNNNNLPDFQAMQTTPQSWPMNENNININSASDNNLNNGFNAFFPNTDPGMVDLDVEDMADVSWEGWDEMVRDYQMEQDLTVDPNRGPTLAGMRQWW